jgi:hypothetical protein
MTVDMMIFLERVPQEKPNHPGGEKVLPVGDGEKTNNKKLR